jgi:glucokinase
VTHALGVDLGGSKLLACVADEDGRLVAHTQRTTGRATGPGAALRLIVDAAAELRELAGPFEAAGVGFPGQTDFASGTAHASVMLDGWCEVPLAQRAAAALGVPCVVDNDVNMAAVAELARRADALPHSMLFVAVGTGIGGAIAIGDRVWRGFSGVAGEIGNVTIDRHGAECWCGRRGCLNTVASGAAIERLLEPGVPLAEQARAGHPRLGEVLEEAAVALGTGLADALNLLNPELVVLGGGVAQLPGFLEMVARTARTQAFPEAGRCRFEPARAGYEAGALGAALLALRNGQARHYATEPPSHRATEPPSHRAT